MARKVVLIADPGIDTAFAVALALHDPGPRRDRPDPHAPATSPPSRPRANVHTLIDQLDPPKWPRTAAALPVDYDTDGTGPARPRRAGRRDVPGAEPAPAAPGRQGARRAGPRAPAAGDGHLPRPATTVGPGLDRDPDLPAADRPAVSSAAAGRSRATPGRSRSSTSTSTRRRPAGPASRAAPADHPAGRDPQAHPLAVRPAGAAQPGVADVPVPAADRPVRHPGAVEPLRHRGVPPQGRARRGGGCAARVA